MAGTRVPTYESSAQPGELPGVRADAPSSPLHMASMLGQQGREQEAMGAGLMKAGGEASNIMVDMQDQANQVRVQDALNQTRQAALNLTFDPNTGYQSLKGDAALNRESGQPLPVEYGNKLQDNINDIAENLGNDRQRQLYAQHASEISNSFQEGIQRHTMEQFNAYQHSVADGAIKLGENQAGLQWNDPNAVQQSVDSVKAATYNKAKLLGLSGDATTAALQQAESGIHTKVIESALENNNPSYAMAYFNKEKGDMTADNILQVQGKINTQMDAHIAMSTVHDTVNDNLTAIAPTNMDRMNQITLQSESGGKRYGADGALTESTTGAKGEMQVEDKTNTNPGFGVKPAQNDSADERARVGRDYLAAMVQHYGGADKGWAAYNAGPGALDTAMDKAKADGKPETWLNYMPKETQNYVSKNMQALQSGGGAQDMPTKLQFVNQAIAKLGDDPRPTVVNLTREQAEKQYDLIQTSNKEAGEKDLGNAQKALIQNGGNFAQLPPSVMSGLVAHDPENYKKAQDFADSISKNKQQTNMDAYSAAFSHPDELAKMSDPVFNQFLKTNFSQPDQEKVVKLRANELHGTTDDSSTALNSKAVNGVLEERLKSIGLGNILTAKKDSAESSQFGGIQKFVNDDLYDQQKQLGRKMTPQEIEQRVDGIFTKQIITPGILYGTNSKPVMATTISDVPSATVDRIKIFLATKGNTNPNDNDVLNLYRRMEMNK